MVTAGEGLITNVNVAWIRGSDLGEWISTQRTCQWKENIRREVVSLLCGYYLLFGFPQLQDN